MWFFNKKKEERKDEQIREIAAVIFKASLDDVENILSTFEKLKLPKKENNGIESKKWDLFYELIIFHMHCLDRMSFEKLSKKERDIFMSKLFKETWNFIKEDYTKNQVAEAKLIFTNTYNKRQSEYGQYQKFLPNTEALEGTLLWEVSCKISKILYNAENILIAMPVLEYLSSSLENRLKETNP